jgi:hypothetical protein
MRFLFLHMPHAIPTSSTLIQSQTIYSEEYKSDWCYTPHCRPKYFLSTLYMLSLLSSLNTTDKNSYPHKTTHEVTVTVPCFQTTNGKTEDSGWIGSKHSPRFAGFFFNFFMCVILLCSVLCPNI